MKKATNMTNGHVARLVLGILAPAALALACTRTAQQANLLGKSCSAAGDCPSELLCVANACREPCGPGGVCDPGLSCQLGACVPGGSVDAGAQQPRPGTNPPPASSGPDPGATEIDGQLVMSGVPYGSSMSAVAVDDIQAAWTATTTDALGQQTTKLYVTPYGGGTNAVYTFPQGAYPPSEMIALGGSVYFVTRATSPSFDRIDGSTGQRSTIVANIGGGRPARVGTYITFTDAAGALRLYDAKTKTPDPIIYASLSGTGAGYFGLHASIQGNTVTWLLDEGPQYVLWRATLGSAATKMARMLPNTGPVDAFAASGNKGILIFNQNLVSLQLDDNSAPVVFGPTTAGEHESSTDDGYLFLVESSMQLGPERLTRVDVNGTKTTFGKSDRINNIYLSPTSVFLTISSISGTASLYKWAKPAQ